MRISHLIPWSQRQLGSCLRDHIILLSFSSGKQMQRARMKTVDSLHICSVIPNLIKTFSDRTELYGIISYSFLINGGQTLNLNVSAWVRLLGLLCSGHCKRQIYPSCCVQASALLCEVPSPSWSGFEFSMCLSINDSDSLYSSHSFCILCAKPCEMTVWEKWLKWWAGVWCT